MTTSTTTTSTTATRTTSATSITSATSTVGTVGRFVDPDDLVCPECGDQAVGVPPAVWLVRGGVPVAQFSHPDRTALCSTVAGQVTDPVEMPR